MAEVFDGIRVLDFTSGMPGGVATMVMGDFGAEVIKVEPPDGETFRDWPGAIQWNRGKKSVTIDLNTPEGQDQARELSLISDVVVESFRPGVTRKLGIDYPTLRDNHPELIYASLTGFGPDGPYSHYKGYDAVVAAKSGRMMMFSGQNPRTGPNYVVVQGACHSAAMALIRGITTALYLREKTGLGQMVETSMLKTITTYDHVSWIQGQMIAKDPATYPPDPRVGIGRPNPTGYLPARTKDGQWLQLGNIVERLFRSMIHSLDLSYIYDDPRYKAAPFLSEEHVGSLERLMLEKIQERTLDEWMKVLSGSTSDVAAEPYLTSEEALKHPQMVHNGHVRTVMHPDVGEMHQLGPLVIMDTTPGAVTGVAPYLGEDTDEALAISKAEKKETESNPSQPMPKTALDGLILLDLGTVINGPLGCALIGELGARVIRIEALNGDWGRQGIQGLSVQRTMAGSEGVCLNLKTPEGQEIMHKLVKKADLLLHSMRPGAPERTGIGYAQLTEINPNLVYLYAGGYGSTGPYSLRPSMAPIAGAVSGGGIAQMGQDSLPSRETPMTIEDIESIAKKLKRANDGTADHNTAMVNAVGLLFGLYARERTGDAQYVESTMIAANAYANADDFYWHQGKIPRRLPDSEGYGLDALYRLYKAKSGWIFLACPFEEEWTVLCKTLGRSDLLVDSRFDTKLSRQHNDRDLAAELSEIFLSKDPLDWEQLLTDADVACVKAEDRGMYHFFNEDEHIRNNGFLKEVAATRHGRFWRYNPVINFSETGGKAEAAPLKGEHTQRILGELGYTSIQILDFKERGIVDWEES